MSAPLHVHLHHQRGVPVLSVAGDLDLYTAPVLRERGEELVDQALAPVPAPDRALSTDDHQDQQDQQDGVVPTRAAPDAARKWTSMADGSPDALVLDLSDVPFVDSSGMGAVVALLKRVRAHHAGLSIAGASPQLQGALHLMGLDKVIMLHDTADMATRAATATSQR